MIHSLRLTLTLWYIGILAVILCLFGGILYTNVARNLAQDIDEVLASQADGVADTIFAFWEAERAPALSSRNPPSEASLLKTLDQIDDEEFPPLIQRWALEEGNVEVVRPVRVIDRRGKALYTSASLTHMQLPVTSNAFREGLVGQTVYETFNLPDHRVRLITRPVIESGRILYLTQVAASLRQADVSLGRLRLWLFWLIPVTLVVTSAGGWFLASLALRPIGQIVSQARKIGAGELHRRIDSPQTGDELEKLATTFNEMLERLERAFRRVRQFTAAASHELRTPLTVMKGELEVSLRKPRGVEEYQEALRAQLETLNQLTGVVGQLLMLARSETGEGAVDWRPVELKELVERVSHLYRTLAESKKIRLELTGENPVWLRGETLLLERLVSNLLENAVRHTPAGGVVVARIHEMENQICLTVQDTGPGIPQEELPKIFDRFFRRDWALENSSSTGLGLGLCRWIAEAHQGRIEATSLPGRGASFTVFLPKMKNL